METSRLFPELVNWAERAKEHLSVGNFIGAPTIEEYKILVHLASNAFLSSFILDMQLQHFHALAIMRIEIDAIMQMAVIEADFDKNSKIWRDYNFANPFDRSYADKKRV